MLWAYAKLRAAPLAPKLIAAIQQRLVRRRPGEYKAHCLSLAVWAFGEIGWPDEPLMASLAEELAQQAEALQPQEICNLCWALSGRLRSSRLLEAVHTALMGGPEGAVTSSFRMEIVWKTASKALKGLEKRAPRRLERRCAAEVQGGRAAGM